MYRSFVAMAANFTPNATVSAPPFLFSLPPWTTLPPSLKSLECCSRPASLSATLLHERILLALFYIWAGPWKLH